jgi:hypothetical protein
VTGATPVVIKAPYSDDGTKFKYMWVAPTCATIGQFMNWQWIPAEDWNATTNTSTNILVTPPTTTTSTGSTWYSCPSYGTPNFVNNGMTWIISASATHLFVWFSNDNTGLTVGNTVFVCEYTREDSWNTVANGYPAWLMTATSAAGGAIAEENGVLIRALNISGGGTADSNMVAMWTNNTAYTNSNWALTTRFRYRKQFPSTFALTNMPTGLNTIGTIYQYWGNSIFARDSAKAQSLLLADIRLDIQSGSYNLFIQGGSLTAKAPYIYVFRSQWQSLDEVDIAGSRYTNLIINNTTPGTATSTLLVKQV